MGVSESTSLDPGKPDAGAGYSAGSVLEDSKKKKRDEAAANLSSSVASTTSLSKDSILKNTTDSAPVYCTQTTF